jgi:hypothetical protein
MPCGWTKLAHRSLGLFAGAVEPRSAFSPSYPERVRCAPSPNLPRPAPGPEEHRETDRWHPQRKREIMGLMAVAVTVSQYRVQPVERLFIGLISFRSAGGVAGPR